MLFYFVYRGQSLLHIAVTKSQYQYKCSAVEVLLGIHWSFNQRLYQKYLRNFNWDRKESSTTLVRLFAGSNSIHFLKFECRYVYAHSCLSGHNLIDIQLTIISNVLIMSESYLVHLQDSLLITPTCYNCYCSIWTVSRIATSESEKPYSLSPKWNDTLLTPVLRRGFATTNKQLSPRYSKTCSQGVKMFHVHPFPWF